MLSLSSSLLRPHPPVCVTPPAFPFGYTESPCHSMAILTVTQTFPTLPDKHCMIAASSTPENPSPVYPVFFSDDFSHRPVRTGLAFSLLISMLQTDVRFRYGPHTCSPY